MVMKAMKKFCPLILLVCLFALSSGKLQSQDLSVTTCTETNALMCTVPDTSQTVSTIYNFGPFGIFADSVSIYYDFGDGTDTTIWTVMTLPAGGVYVFTMDHIYTTPGVYNKIVAVNNPGSFFPSSNDTCSSVVVIAPGCGTLYGNTYIDNNANCVFDAGDDTLRYYPVYLIDSSGIYSGTVFSDSLGSYSIAVASGIGYVASVNIGSANLSYACPLSGNYGFTGTTGSILYDWGLTCLPGFDARVTTNNNMPVPGSSIYVNILASNLSCLPVSGTITLEHDSLFTYISSTTTPSSITDTSISWNYFNLDIETGAPLINGILETVNFMTDTAALMGDTVLFHTHISPTIGDIDSTNNDWLCHAIIGASFDPNMKQVSPLGSGASGNVAPNTTFTYTVHFQNTGTAPATDVVIQDTIDSNLDITTFQLMGSSHYMTSNISSGNTLTATFNNINLPDSTTNEPASHGWFTYRVKAKTGLSSGTPILNTAYIFFDFNPAIITNTTLNTIDIPSTFIYENTPTVSGIHVFPNPSSTNVNIKLDEAINATIMLIDITGQIVMTNAINGNNSVINVESLPSGIYQIVIPGTTTLTARFQKVK